MTISQSSAPDNHAWLRAITLAGLLLAIAAARVLRLEDVNLHNDEIWSVWQGFGSWSDVIRWTPYDWPPLYFLMLDLWVELVGLQPLVLRMLSVLCFLIGASCFYHILHKHVDSYAALIGTLIYGGMTYTIYLSIELRGYPLMMGLIPLAWVVAHKMLKRARWWHAVCFAILVSAAVYTTYISIFPVAFLFLYILWMSPSRARRVLNYWALALFLTLVSLLPLVVFILPLVFSRVESTSKIILPPIHEAIASWYMHSFGQGTWLIFAMVVIGIGVLFWQRKVSRIQALFLFWGVISLPTLYLLNSFLAFFGSKYASWIFIGIAGFIAVTVARLPRSVRRIVTGAASLFFLLPVPLPVYFQPADTFELAHHLSLNFSWLSEEIQAGDRIVLAEDQECTTYSYLWNHPLFLNIPQGLNITDSTASHRRIWFVTADGSPNSPHWETLRRDYVERHFVGPPGCLFRLYEGPPDREGVLFANGLRFHGAQFLQEGEPLPPGFSPQLHEGEAFQVRFWWMVDEPLSRDYSVGAFLFDEEGRVVDEVHGPPDPTHPGDAPRETSRWQGGEIYYEDREFETPYPLARQELELRLAVYYWEEPAQRFAASGTDAFGMLSVMKIAIDSW